MLSKTKALFFNTYVLSSLGLNIAVKVNICISSVKNIFYTLYKSKYFDKR